MVRLRRALGPIASAWLVCQAATLALGPVIFWDTSVEALLECTCGHGDHAICPMHHAPARDSKRCRLVPSHDADAGLLTPLLTGIALMPDVQPLPAVTISSSLLDSTRDVVLVRPWSPDRPPPRA